MGTYEVMTILGDQKVKSALWPYIDRRATEAQLARQALCIIKTLPSNIKRSFCLQKTSHEDSDEGVLFLW